MSDFALLRLLLLRAVAVAAPLMSFLQLFADLCISSYSALPLVFRLPSTASIEIQLTFKKLITMSKTFLCDEPIRPSGCFCQDCIAELEVRLPSLLSFFVVALLLCVSLISFLL